MKQDFRDLSSTTLPTTSLSHRFLIVMLMPIPDLYHC